jgi:hypothetical protein
MGIFWGSIAIGLLLVAAGVGIPFTLTHRKMRPHDPDEAHAYLDAKEEVARTADPGRARPGKRAAGRPPRGRPADSWRTG